jgi:hypothetical protein
MSVAIGEGALFISTVIHSHAPRGCWNSNAARRIPSIQTLYKGNSAGTAMAIPGQSGPDPFLI